MKEERSDKQKAKRMDQQRAGWDNRAARYASDSYRKKVNYDKDNNKVSDVETTRTGRKGGKKGIPVQRTTKYKDGKPVSSTVKRGKIKVKEDIKNLINNVLDRDPSSTKTQVDNILQQKISDALNDRKEEIAQSLLSTEDVLEEE